MNTNINRPPETKTRCLDKCPGLPVMPSVEQRSGHRSDNQDEIMELWEAIQMLSKRLDALDGGQDRENKH